MRADRDHPVSKGFTCVKGRQLVEQHNDPARLRQTLRRREGGGFEPIPSAQGIEEVTQIVTRIIEQHGPRAVALYCGTKSWSNAAPQKSCFVPGAQSERRLFRSELFSF